jgi:VanZ family protein
MAGNYLLCTFYSGRRFTCKTIFKIPHFDKLVHFGLFFVFCLLLINPMKKLKYKHYIVPPLISIVLSALLEISQHVISTSRSSNIYDFMANTAGIIGSVIFISYLFRAVSGKSFFKVLQTLRICQYPG